MMNALCVLFLTFSPHASDRIQEEEYSQEIVLRSSPGLPKEIWLHMMNELSPQGLQDFACVSKGAAHIVALDLSPRVLRLVKSLNPANFDKDFPLGASFYSIIRSSQSLPEEYKELLTCTRPMITVALLLPAFKETLFLGLQSASLILEEANNTGRGSMISSLYYIEQVYNIEMMKMHSSETRFFLKKNTAALIEGFCHQALLQQIFPERLDKVWNSMLQRSRKLSHLLTHSEYEKEFYKTFTHN